MLNCEPRQARKGATVVVAACAGMWLLGPPPFLGHKIDVVIQTSPALQDLVTISIISVSAPAE